MPKKGKGKKGKKGKKKSSKKIKEADVGPVDPMAPSYVPPPPKPGDQVGRFIISDFQQCGILTSIDSYEPVQPPLKLTNSK